MTGAVECRYYGRDFTAEEMALLRALIAVDPQPTRAALSREFCRRIGWFKPDGGLKDMMARVAALPRTGLAPQLRGCEEFEQIVRTYKQIGAIEDASELRWDIRPLAHYPTIELRICDICPKVEDAIAIAALYACLRASHPSGSARCAHHSNRATARRARAMSSPDKMTPARTPRAIAMAPRRTIQ